METQQTDLQPAIVLWCAGFAIIQTAAACVVTNYRGVLHKGDSGKATSSVGNHRQKTAQTQDLMNSTGGRVESRNLVALHAEDAVAIVSELSWVRIQRAAIGFEASGRLLRASLVTMVR